MDANRRTNKNDNALVGKASPPRSTVRLAGGYIGFGGMLKLWRKAAGVTQATAWNALGISERSYRAIENGATPPRFTQYQCDALAVALKLDRDERHALLLHNVGTYLRDSSSEETTPGLRRSLRLLIDRQMPSPCYLSDRNWNILAYNPAMAELWPWVMEPQANLIRWALTTDEGRATYHDWHKHAQVFVRMLRFAQTTHGNDPTLQKLIEDVTRNPDVLQLWDTDADLVEHRDGHVYRASVSTLGWRTIEIVSHVAYPAIMPDCRFVVLTWVDAERDPALDALGGLRDAWAEERTRSAVAVNRAQDRIAEADRNRAEDAYTASLLVENPDQAAAHAGHDGIPLPTISRLLGPTCQLTLSPTRRNVVWAKKEAHAQWSITHVDASTVLARIPWQDRDGPARDEVKRLTRIALPADPAAARERVAQLRRDLGEQRALLDEIEDELPGRIPPHSSQSS